MGRDPNEASAADMLQYIRDHTSQVPTDLAPVLPTSEDFQDIIANTGNSCAYNTGNSGRHPVHLQQGIQPR